MQGKIIKGIAGFYYIYANHNIYECKAKGIFRNQKVKPLVGDNVEISVIDEQNKIGDFIGTFALYSQLISQELELWKLMKRALMQKIFI